MVRLTRIYTRTGDEGMTSLGDGRRVSKTAPRIEAYGTVDELNAVVGLCLDHAPPPLRERLVRIQHDLFDLGADLCVPLDASPEVPALRLGPARVERIEAWIDEVNAKLAPLTSFVLPGGNPLASHLHLARTVCRRAERMLAALDAIERIKRVDGIYLNRLADLFFVLSREAAGPAEILWVPQRDEPAPGGAT